MEEQGKVALVTGGGRGIGRAIATALARTGWDIVVVARSAGELEETAAAVRELGRRALAIPMDVTETEAVNRAVEAACAFGSLRVLVNNAGVAPSLKFEETTDELWARTMGVNLTAAFAFCRAALPSMLAAGWGRIINIASTSAKVGYMYNAAYVASKHGLMGLTRALAMEVARKGITVNAVCPGFVDTDIARLGMENLIQRTGRSAVEARRAYESMSPQNRLFTPEEVAEAVVYLTSDAARGINGQGLVIDGGGVQS